MSRDERCFFFSPRPNSLVPAPPCSIRCSLDQPQAPTGVPGEGSRGPWTASQRFKGLQRAVVLMAWQNPTQQCNKAGQTGCFWMRLWIRYVIDNVSRIMWHLVPSSCRGRKLIKVTACIFSAITGIWVTIEYNPKAPPFQGMFLGAATPSQLQCTAHATTVSTATELDSLPRDMKFSHLI